MHWIQIEQIKLTILFFVVIKILLESWMGIDLQSFYIRNRMIKWYKVEINHYTSKVQSKYRKNSHRSIQVLFTTTTNALNKDNIILLKHKLNIILLLVIKQIIALTCNLKKKV